MVVEAANWWGAWDRHAGLYALAQPFFTGRRVLELWSHATDDGAGLRAAGAAEAACLAPAALPLALPDGAAEVVLCPNFVPGATEEERAAWLREIARVLTPDGVCVLRAPVPVEAEYEESWGEEGVSAEAAAGGVSADTAESEEAWRDDGGSEEAWAEEGVSAAGESAPAAHAAAGEDDGVSAEAGPAAAAAAEIGSGKPGGVSTEAPGAGEAPAPGAEPVAAEAGQGVAEAAPVADGGSLDGGAVAPAAAEVDTDPGAAVAAEGAGTAPAGETAFATEGEGAAGPESAARIPDLDGAFVGEAETAADPRVEAWRWVLPEEFGALRVIEELPFAGVSFRVAGTEDLAIVGDLSPLGAPADHEVVLCAKDPSALPALTETLLVPLPGVAPGSAEEQVSEESPAELVDAAGAPDELSEQPGLPSLHDLGVELERLSADLAAAMAARDSAEREREAAERERDEARLAATASRDRDSGREATIASLRAAVERQLARLADVEVTLGRLGSERDEALRRAEAAEEALHDTEAALRRREWEAAGLARDLDRFGRPPGPKG